MSPNQTKDDIFTGLLSWRIWLLLGISDIRQRYTRSRLGQFWITLSMAIFIAAIGSVNSILFNQDVSNFIPFLAANVIVWNLISGIITDGSTTFIQSENYLKQIPLPKSTFIMRSITRNLVNFFNNIFILTITFIVFPQPLNVNYLLAPLGLILILLAGFFITMLLGVLCARFRDLPQIIGNIVQLAFFITPIMWPANALRSDMINFGIYNPFAAFLNILSEPLRGIIPSYSSYLITASTILLLAIIAIPLFSKYRARIPYWL
jgi:ABC-type polysaccharide/polyol phosphate export permease